MNTQQNFNKLLTSIETAIQENEFPVSFQLKLQRYQLTPPTEQALLELIDFFDSVISYQN